MPKTPKKSECNKKKAVKRKVVESSEEEDNVEMILNDSSSDNENFIGGDDDDDNIPTTDDISSGDFVLVKIAGKRLLHHYVAEVLECYADRDEYAVVYYKKHGVNKFVKSESEKYDICQSDVVKKLPLPKCEGGSERQIFQITFNLDFSAYNLGY